MRYDGRLGGYVRLSKSGLAIASPTVPERSRGPWRHGQPQDVLVQCSRTYPDRLFFLGGVDSVRGFAQDSMVPEDIAEQLLDRPRSTT